VPYTRNGPRRRWILGAAAVVAIGVALGGWSAIRNAQSGYRATRGARVVGFTLHGSLVHADLHDVVVTPAGGGRGRPLLVFLHGRSSPADSNLTQQLFDTLHSLGRRAPVVFMPDGGDHSYWHDRRDGRWGTEVLREAIPAALRRSGADARRVAIGGISMGGFGALDLARIAPRRFCAVGAHSAAIWFSGGDTAAGAFDDAADFDRHDLIRFAHDRRVFGEPVWIDVGRKDPFATADESLARELRRDGTRLTFHLHAGGHSGWAKRMPAYLRWYAARLAHCHDR
jgi:S-formylglutathione hydrolase FrmB